MLRKLVFFVMLLGTAALVAHPPSSVVLTFDNTSKTLTVNYSHKVSDPTDHFVDNIIVDINGMTVVTQTQFSQPTREGGEVKYIIADAKAGDIIKVIANCNKKGRTSQTIKVEG